MASIIDYFNQAELSFAAYADLERGTPDTQALQGESVGMSAIQAAQFASEWIVVDQYPDASGASATVFQEVATGNRYLAIRGTESPGDFHRRCLLKQKIILTPLKIIALSA